MRCLLPFLLALVACGCATARPAAEVPATFVVLRHAEKTADGSRDPPLNAAGEAWAQRMAAALRDAPVVAVYATGYRRTRDTAAPTAARHGLAVTTYDANEDAATFAARLRAQHAQGMVLVVGHGNTVPAIAAALCGCAARPLGEQDYGRVYRIRITASGGRLEESVLP
jgi:broad specificity phosphatase PhoE